MVGNPPRSSQDGGRSTPTVGHSATLRARADGHYRIEQEEGLIITSSGKNIARQPVG
jgi:hypothetical protein